MTQTSTNSSTPSTGETPVSQEAVIVALPVADVPADASAPGSTPLGDVPAATLVYLTPIGEFIHGADGKAGTILTVLGLMFTLLARFSPWLDAVIRGGASGGAGRVWMVVAIALISVFATASIAAVVQAFRTISPRFPHATPSLVFFGDIARLSHEQYLARLSGLNPEQALVERMKYNYTGAHIIILKKRQLRWMFIWFEVAGVSWMLLASVLAWRALAA